MAFLIPVPEKPDSDLQVACTPRLTVVWQLGLDTNQGLGDTNHRVAESLGIVVCLAECQISKCSVRLNQGLIWTRGSPYRIRPCSSGCFLKR